MKTANSITLKHSTRTIEVTKKFYEAASKYNSEAELLLREVQQNHPNYKVVVASRKTTKSTFKGLTYEYMTTYIKAHDDDKKTKMATFLEMRALTDEAIMMDVAPADYLAVKEWFLNEFPEIVAFHAKRQQMLDDIEKKTEEKRLARQKKNRALLMASFA